MVLTYIDVKSYRLRIIAYTKSIVHSADQYEYKVSVSYSKILNQMSDTITFY